MRSIYTDRKRKQALEKTEKLRFKRLGFDGRDRASRRKHEERVQKIYGKSTAAMATSVNERTKAWTQRYGPALIAARQTAPPSHPSLMEFRSKFDPKKSLHHRSYVSVANDSLIPRKHLHGGGLLNREKSMQLSQSLKDCRTMLTERKPLRLVQPPYRQPEYPLRERDPTRDLGPSGGSIGGMVYSHHSDQERLVKSRRQACATLADNGTSPWNELATRHALMPEFRPRPHPKSFRSSTAPAGFYLTDKHPKRQTITTKDNKQTDNTTTKEQHQTKDNT